jgi:hypothetical protein
LEAVSIAPIYIKKERFGGNVCICSRHGVDLNSRRRNITAKGCEDRIDSAVLAAVADKARLVGEDRSSYYQSAIDHKPLGGGRMAWRNETDQSSGRQSRISARAVFNDIPYTARKIFIIARRLT